MLFLIRHARTVQDPAVPVAEWRLDPAGAEAVVALERAHPWREVPRWYSSPEHKATATAAALTDREPVLLDGLREVRRGGWHEDYAGTVGRFFAVPDAAPAPGWETANAALARFDACLWEIAGRSSDDAVVVSHGLVITLWLAHLRRRPVDLAAWSALGFPELLALPDEELRAWRTGGPPPAEPDAAPPSPADLNER